MLPEGEKERLCLDLLSEFGVNNYKTGGDGELIHSCCLPFGQHKNGDASASASLNYKKLTYNCLGCGSSGGLLWFIGSCRGTSGTEAREWLGKATGTDGEIMDLSKLMAYFDALYGPKKNTRTPMPRMDPKVLNQWAFLHPYMYEDRGIPVETLQRYLIGYAENYVLDQYGTTSERIIIPQFWDGSLVGWQTRRIVDDGSPKYKNSPDFPKDTTIYNFHPQGRRAVVVESPLSVLRHVHHVPDIEATFSATLTARQIKLLARHDEVIFWFDNDDAGWKAVNGRTEGKGRYAVHHPGAAEQLEYYSTVKVVPSEWAADPADMDDATVDELIAQALPYSVWKPPQELKRWKEEQWESALSASS